MHSFLSQSELSNFFGYIINAVSLERACEGTVLRDTRIDKEAMTCNVKSGHHLRKFLTPETRRKMGTNFRRSDFWDRLGGQALLMIGSWLL